MLNFSSVAMLSLYSSVLTVFVRNFDKLITSNWCTRRKSFKSRATPDPIHAEHTSQAAAVTCDGVSVEKAGRIAAPTFYLNDILLNFILKHDKNL